MEYGIYKDDNSEAYVKLIATRVIKEHDKNKMNMAIRRDGCIHSRHKLRIDQSHIIKVNAMVTTLTYVCSPPRLECKSSNVRVSAGTQANKQTSRRKYKSSKGENRNPIDLNEVDLSLEEIISQISNKNFSSPPSLFFVTAPYIVLSLTTRRTKIKIFNIALTRKRISLLICSCLNIPVKFKKVLFPVKFKGGSADIPCALCFLGLGFVGVAGGIGDL
ncbi:hypothetical protein V1477_008318 [Vespula maculifrons]|uniref:Uncharacterized protein n=1 Tax=Vespula maculifrons TaxID=7453 RepID=A0ABD2CDJ4_VESMC